MFRGSSVPTVAGTVTADCRHSFRLLSVDTGSQPRHWTVQSLLLCCSIPCRCEIKRHSLSLSSKSFLRPTSERAEKRMVAEVHSSTTHNVSDHLGKICAASMGQTPFPSVALAPIILRSIEHLLWKRIYAPSSGDWHGPSDATRTPGPGKNNPATHLWLMAKCYWFCRYRMIWHGVCSLGSYWSPMAHRQWPLTFHSTLEMT
jgi:hypothetical protein